MDSDRMNRKGDTMTRKDYVKLAEAFKASFDATSQNEDVDRPAVELGIILCVNRVANVLKADNPTFDRVRFLTACGLN